MPRHVMRHLRVAVAAAAWLAGSAAWAQAPKCSAKLPAPATSGSSTKVSSKGTNGTGCPAQCPSTTDESSASTAKSSTVTLDGVKSNGCLDPKLGTTATTNTCINTKTGNYVTTATGNVTNKSGRGQFYINSGAGSDSSVRCTTYRVSTVGATRYVAMGCVSSGSGSEE